MITQTSTGIKHDTFASSTTARSVRAGILIIQVTISWSSFHLIALINSVHYCYDNFHGHKPFQIELLKAYRLNRLKLKTNIRDQNVLCEFHIKSFLIKETCVY